MSAEHENGHGSKAPPPDPVAFVSTLPPAATGELPPGARVERYVVLKRLGLQPWTWVTTAGWIAVITLGAILVGGLFKSGTLSYRTTTVIDEADHSRIAALTLAGIYSPRTTDYTLATEPHMWWQPAADPNPWGGGGGIRVRRGKMGA